MRTRLSQDGTVIAYWPMGNGPGLLLVHGATADHTATWRFVQETLAERFTLYAMDRRGRGGSGDTFPYSLQREAEDIAAVIDAIGGPVHVLGHSYGGLCAFEAALLTPNVDRLILYESVPVDGSQLYRPEAIEKLNRLLAAGDVEGMLISMFRDVVELPQADVDSLRSQGEAWAVRLRNAPTLPRELAEERAYRFDAHRFRQMTRPTLLLVGEDSPARERENATAIAAALPNAQVRYLPGQQHGAMYTAPELFVHAVVEFLASEQTL